jgi:hypothetical protein
MPIRNAFEDREAPREQSGTPPAAIRRCVDDFMFASLGACYSVKAVTTDPRGLSLKKGGSKDAQAVATTPAYT